MRVRSIATVVAMVLAGMALGGVSEARPFNGGTSTAVCGDGTVTATPGRLWPPNHKLKTVTLTYEETGDDGDTIGLEIDAVTHDEEGSEKGSTKRHEPDFVATFDVPSTAIDDADPSTAPPTQLLQLRKERMGKNGRTYSIDVTCTDDDAGNLGVGATSDPATVTVCVPHSRRGGKSHC